MLSTRTASLTHTLSRLVRCRRATASLTHTHTAPLPYVPCVLPTSQRLMRLRESVLLTFKQVAALFAASDHGSEEEEGTPI